MNNICFIFLASSLLCGVTYFLTTKKRPFFFDVIIKGYSISLLGGFIANSSNAFIADAYNGPIAMLICAAFIIASIGDMLLAVDECKYLLQGIASFAISYIMYAFVFSTKFIGLYEISNSAIVLIILMLISVIIAYCSISNRLGKLKIPVLIYMAIITSMVITAFLGDFGNPLIMIGALLLLISDIILAIGIFKKDELSERFTRFGNYFTWGSYYAGQVLIAVGFVKAFG